MYLFIAIMLQIEFILWGLGSEDSFKNLRWVFIFFPWTPSWAAHCVSLAFPQRIVRNALFPERPTVNVMTDVALAFGRTSDISFLDFGLASNYTRRFREQSLVAVSAHACAGI